MVSKIAGRMGPGSVMSTCTANAHHAGGTHTTSLFDQPLASRQARQGNGLSDSGRFSRRAGHQQELRLLVVDIYILILPLLPGVVCRVCLQPSTAQLASLDGRQEDDQISIGGQPAESPET